MNLAQGRILLPGPNPRQPTPPMPKTRCRKEMRCAQRSGSRRRTGPELGAPRAPARVRPPFPEPSILRSAGGCRRGAAHASHRDRRLAAHLTRPAGVAVPRRRHGEDRSASRCHCRLSQILPRGGRKLGRGICTRPWREPSLDQWLNQTPGMVGRAASARAGSRRASAAGNVLCVTWMGAPRITGKVVRHGNR